MTVQIDIGVVIATLFLAWVGWRQLVSINKTSKADFIHKFKKDFFREKTTILIILFDNELLEYERDKSYFKFEEDNMRKSLKGEDFKNSLIQAFGYFKTAFNCYEIDDLLLGHFEDLGLFERHGMIDIDMVYELYDWYNETFGRIMR